MADFIALVQTNGVEGLIVGLAVLLVVFALSKSKVVVTGDQKRLANIVLSILLGGVSILNPEANEVVVSAIASVASALVYELIRYLNSKPK